MRPDGKGIMNSVPSPFINVGRKGLDIYREHASCVQFLIIFKQELGPTQPDTGTK